MDNLQFNNQNQNLSNNNNGNNNIVKYAVMGVGALVAIIVVVLVFSVLFGGGYKKPIKAADKALDKHKIDSYEYADYTSLKSYREYVELKNELLDEDDHEDAYEETIEELEDEFGSKFKVKIKITDKEKLDKDDRKDIADGLEDYYESTVDNEDDSLDYLEELCDEEDVSSKDFKKLKKAYEAYIKDLKKIKVSKAYELKLEVTIKGKEDEDDFKIKNLIVAKVNGEWVYVSEVGEDLYAFGGGINPTTVYWNTMAD
ncbi:MAG: hypothetical protein J6L69_02710 [Lachnospiraceae bacterium]|nr:hypothetical protein [Lachnospiraceae bacterium]